MQREETLNINVLEYKFFKNLYFIVFIKAASTLKNAFYQVFSLAFNV